MLNLESVNKWFRNVGKVIVKLRWFNFFVFILIMVVAFVGLQRIQIDVSNESWFLKNDPMRVAENEFREIFGNNDYVAVLVEADDVFTPKVLAKVRELGKELEQNVPFADDVLSVTDFEFTKGTKEGMEIIDPVPENIPTSSAKLEKIRKLSFSKPAILNRLVSDNSKQTWVILRLKPYPDTKEWLKTHDETPELLAAEEAEKIINQDKYKILHPKATGMPILNFDKRNFFTKEISRTMPLSLLATIVVLIIALRSFRGVMFPLITAIGSIIIVFGIQGYLGITMDPTFITVPIYLGLAVAIGYSIHIFNSFKQQFLKTGNRLESVYHAVEETGWPLFFTALTTIAGLLSFLFVQARQVRWIGLTTASVIGVTFVLVIILNPSLLSFGKDRKPNPDYIEKGGGLLERCMAGMGKWILAHPKSIMTVFIIAVLVCMAGLTKLGVSFDMCKTMGLKIPYVARMDYVRHSKIGSLYSYNLILDFDKADAAKDPENLKKFEQLISQVEKYPLTKRTTSISDVIKDMNQVLNGGDPAYYRIPKSREMIAQLLLLYENAGGTEAERWVDYDYKRLRLMVELGDYNSAEAQRELSKLKKSAKELFPDATVGVVGTVAKFTRMQQYVSYGQIKSFLAAMVVIAVLLIFVFGSIKTGLIAMIPNVASALAVGGIMGWADIPLDIMTVTIMPMLLGLAVDDTIHFVNHSKLEFERTKDYTESIKRTFVSIGTALFMTSIAIIANFSAYITSVAKILIHIGILACAGIIGALLADYFITPILLKWSKSFGKER